MFGSNVFNEAITVDAASNIYVSGTYEGDSVVVAGNITLINTGDMALYTVKYNKTSHAEWAESASVSANIFPTGLAADTHGNVFVTGYTTADTLIFGADTAFTFSTSAASNFFVAGYDSSGNTLWVHCTQNSNNITSTGIGADAGGHVYITGYFANSSVNIGQTTLSNMDTINQNQAFFIAEYDASGNVVWVSGGLTAEDDLDGGGIG